jgi:hypothetical protein
MKITYTAHDGKAFETESACLAHERKLAGYIHVCPHCKGQGTIEVKSPIPQIWLMKDSTYRKFTNFAPSFSSIVIPNDFN